MDSTKMPPPPQTSLPDRIVAWIRSEGGSNALLLITVDAWLRPHIMMLAVDEVFVISETALRVAVGERTRSAENLRLRSSATLAIYDADLAGVIKTHATEGPRKIVAETVAFDLAVEEVRFDTPAAAEASARLVSGLRFEGRAERTDIQNRLAKL